MFTGLTEEVGVVRSLGKNRAALQIEISAKKVLADLDVDDSISLSGVCLTVTKVTSGSFFVEAVEETLKKTNLHSLQIGHKVNLERCLRFSDRLGGHLVQGHVDSVGRVKTIRPQKGGRLLTIVLPGHVQKYVISEGSIAVDGVSLTVARISGNEIKIALIPHTLEQTTLSGLKVGDSVNLEVDLIGKYVEKLLTHSNDGKFSDVPWQQIGEEILSSDIMDPKKERRTPTRRGKNAKKTQRYSI